MKLLPGPYGWDNPGRLVHSTLQLATGPGRDAFDHEAIRNALWHHSCPPFLHARILSCLEHSLYQCLMRTAVAEETRRCGCLGRAGVAVSWRILGTHVGTDGPQIAPIYPGRSRANTGPVGVK